MRARFLLFILFTVFAFVSAVAASAPLNGLGDPLIPQAGNPGYDVQHYTLDLSVLSVESGAINAMTTIELLATQNLSSFFVDFGDFTIERLLLNGQPARFAYAEGELRVLPEAPLTAGERYVLLIDYRGQPEPTINPMLGETGWTVYEDGIYLAGQPFSATSIMPVNDHPRDKATYTVRITVPRPYTAVSNGLLLETQPVGGARTYTYDMRQPMASYLLTIVIGAFDVQVQEGVDGLPIHNYFPPDAPDYVAEAFTNQPQILAFLSARFGPYPFESAGSIVVDDPEMGFALETQSIPIYSAGMTRFAGEQVVVHELAHQWFGNSISLTNWSDLWLNEGFASYAEALWVEHTDGEAAFKRYLNRFYLTARMSNTLPGAPAFDRLFDGAVYHRGALTLHALRYTVGDEAFFDILRAYTDRYQYSNATTADFITISEEIAQVSLGNLFETWLLGSLPPRSAIGLN
jgi:aminopeptidase N